MSESDYKFHDPDALAKTADGYVDKADRIKSYYARVTALMYDVYAAAGDDKDGRKFAETHQGTADQFRQGVKSLADGTTATADNIKGSAHVYRVTEESATDGAKAFAKDMQNLTTDTPPPSGPAGSERAGQRSPESPDGGTKKALTDSTSGSDVTPRTPLEYGELKPLIYGAAAPRTPGVAPTDKGSG